MLLSIIIFILLIFILLKDFNKGIIILVSFSVLLKHFQILSGSIFNYLTLIVFILSLFKSNISWKSMNKFPFIISYIVLLSSIIISNFLGEIKHYGVVSFYIGELYLYFCCWQILKQRNGFYLNKFLKYCIFLGGIIGIYSLFETITRTNPYVNFVNSLGAYINDFLITEIRFGVKRSQTLFAMHTTNAGISLILFYVLFYIKKYSSYHFKKISILIITLLLVNIFFSGTRSAIIGTIICLITFYDKKILSPKYILLFLLIIIITSSILSNYFQEIIGSIVDTNKVGGSNSEMRSNQFEIGFFFLNKSFWFGNGINYIWEIVLPDYKELYGAESLWLPIMVDQGFFGIIAYSLLIINFIYYIYIHKQKKLIFFVVGFVVFNSMSSIPCVSIISISIYLIAIIELLSKYTKHETFNHTSNLQR